MAGKSYTLIQTQVLIERLAAPQAQPIQLEDTVVDGPFIWRASGVDERGWGWAHLAPSAVSPFAYLEL